MPPSRSVSRFDSLKRLASAMRASMKISHSLLLATLLLPLSQIAAHALPLDPITAAEDDRAPLAPALQSAIHSPRAELRRLAARAFGRIQRPEGVGPLLELLGDPS